ncbi:hypothetical protein [Streptomyces sp. TLI_105]|uniref:hypothetical protein n=1 Tax=Streptomyces sp. TLI_105 TaxID=1881019 RepID=UPI0008946BB6|nr:hypothetical protein [Streptomyces sp. TLI_105]SEC10628.1 hypothetical protein SAMN05428939_1579 [Streptomyces sp. TLI_105]
MQSVRGRLGLGRLLPLGGPDDGTWITEQAAVRALWRKAAGIPGVRLQSMRIGPVPHEPVLEPAVRPPTGGLPPGPLGIEAAFTGSVTTPVPQAAEQLRTILLETADEDLGLSAATVDLRVTDLHEGPEADGGPQTAENVMMPPSKEAPTRSSAPATATEPLRGVIGELADVASAVPGVARLTAPLGGHPVRVTHQDDPPARHIQIQLAVVPGRHPLEVARAVRDAVTVAATSDVRVPTTAAVLITGTAA